MRLDYPLSDETIQAINNRQAMADWMGWNRSQIDQILGGFKPDPMAYMKPWYNGLVGSGQNYIVYDDWFSSARDRYRTPQRGCNAWEIISEKLPKDAEHSKEIIKMIEDGKIDDRERIKLRKIAEQIRAIADKIDQITSGSIEVERGQI